MIARALAAAKAVALRVVAGMATAAGVALFSPAAQAAFLSGETLDKAADWIALIVLIVVPIGLLVLFWLVHILPEKVAEKRHHPQKDAITTLCLLSLAFGGLLWPIAWLWAYTRPVGYKMAYGTEKHEDYFLEMGDRAKSGALVDEEIRHLRAELDAMAAKGNLPPVLKGLRTELDALKELEQAAPAAETGKA